MSRQSTSGDRPPAAGRRLSVGLITAVAVGLIGCGSSTPSDAPALGVVGKPLNLVVKPDGKLVIVETDRGAWQVSPVDPPGAASTIAARLRTPSAEAPIRRLLTVAYPSADVMVGSSHPDRPTPSVERDLGLIVSRDEGRTWSTGSLYGKADLHLMRPTEQGLWALDVTSFKLAITNNEGRTWTFRKLPGIVTDLAVDPRDPDHGLVVTQHGLLETHDAARTWRPAAFGDAEAIAWSRDGTLFGIARDGSVRRADDHSEAGRTIGRIGGQARRLATADGRTLWALGGKSLSRSSDGGRTWSVHATLR